MGQKGSSMFSRKKKAADNVEDAETICIDSSPLHCPVCMLVFAEAPEILACGHSFCSRCLDGTVRAASREQPINEFFECPLCRAHHHKRMGRGVRNFAVEAILDSIEMNAREQIADDHDKKVDEAEGVTMAGIRICMKRMNQQNLLLQENLKMLRMRLERQQQLITVLALALIGVLGYGLVSNTLSAMFT